MTKKPHLFVVAAAASAATSASLPASASAYLSATGSAAPLAFATPPIRFLTHSGSIPRPRMGHLAANGVRGASSVNGAGKVNSGSNCGGSGGSGTAIFGNECEARGPLQMEMKASTFTNNIALLRPQSIPSSRNDGVKGPKSFFENSLKNLGSLSGQYGGFGNRITTSSSLSVSSKSSDNVLGFQVEDFEYLGDSDLALETASESSETNDDDDDDFAFTFFEEDFESINNSNSSGSGTTSDDEKMEATKGLKITTLDALLASPTKLKVAESVLRSGRIKPGEKEDDVPTWLPSVPSQSEILRLKVVELRAACAERGLVMTGLKADLRRRLLLWAAVQRVGLTALVDINKNKESGDVTEELDVASLASPYPSASTTTSPVTTSSTPYDVDKLKNKRMAFTNEQKKRSRKNKRGILGLVDESFFDNTSTEKDRGAKFGDEEDDDDEVDDNPVDESNLPSSDDGQYITNLSRTFNAPSSNYSNRDVREMYVAAKKADQEGNRQNAKSILNQLREATPHDMRVVRRLARMEQEDGNIAKARTMLQHALRLEPDNPHLLHGLGQLERQAGHDKKAIQYFRQAVKRSPDFPNPYHALGTLEHTHGNIKSALSVIKEGIRKCPGNHRLLHALGDIYLDAKILDSAEDSYFEGLECGPNWSRPFFYSALSFVSYEKGHISDCRALLRQALEVNGGMHAQGVIALAQLEESEGNIEEARKVYSDAVLKYEKKRRKRSSFGPNKPGQEDNSLELSSIFDGPKYQYTRSYAGDKWINVFKSWARMEEIHGSYETAHVVYSQAAMLFPNNAGLLIQWAELQATHGNDEKARLLFKAACNRVKYRSAEPYRLFAEFEMRRRNFEEAQSILSRGAQGVVDSSGSGVDGKIGLAYLFHTWGVCEFHLGHEDLAEQLFKYALRVTGPGEVDSATRSLILYSMARLQFSRGEYVLAQHFIGLSLKENLMPGGNSLIWRLWAAAAEKMENKDLAQKCKEQALLRWREEKGGSAADLSRLLGKRDDDSSALPERTATAMKDMFRQSPWYGKVCTPTTRIDKNWYVGARLWYL